jgi:nucleoid-associated protein YgaU
VNTNSTGEHAHPWWIPLLLSLIICLGALRISPSTAETQVSLRPTDLTIAFPPVVVVGTEVTVRAALTADGNSLPQRTITLTVDNRLVLEGLSDASGIAVFQLTVEQLPTADDITLLASYAGSSVFAKTQAAGILVVEPVHFTITTVPPLSGARFALDDHIFTSDAEGIAIIDVPTPGRYSLEVLPITATVRQVEPVKITFSQWQDGTTTARRSVMIPEIASLHAGFDVAYQVAVKFVDNNEIVIDASRITMLELLSSRGDLLVHQDFTESEKMWQPAITVHDLGRNLEAIPLSYTVQQVTIDGSYHTDVRQALIRPAPGAAFEVQLFLYSADFSGRDALLGSSLGSGITLQLPDESLRTRPFDSERRSHFEGLSSGLYYVSVEGVAGFAPRIPLVVDRNQTLDLLVLSRLDIALGAIGCLLVAVGLLLVGWPQLLSSSASSPPKAATPQAFARPKARRGRNRGRRLAFLLVVLGAGILVTFAVAYNRVIVSYTQAVESAQHGAVIQMASPTATATSTLPTPQFTATALIVGVLPPTPSRITPSPTTVIPTLTPSPTLTPTSTPMLIPTESPTVTIEPTTRAEPTHVTHVIKSGDTLVNLAAFYYNNADLWQVIFDANDEILSSIDQLPVGEKIEIPTLQHVVQPGESLSRIAQNYYQDSDLWEPIFIANRNVLSTPERVEEGQLLYVPPLHATPP